MFCSDLTADILFSVLFSVSILHRESFMLYTVYFLCSFCAFCVLLCLLLVFVLRLPYSIWLCIYHILSVLDPFPLSRGHKIQFLLFKLANDFLIFILNDVSNDCSLLIFANFSALYCFPSVVLQRWVCSYMKFLVGTLS